MKELVKELVKGLVPPMPEICGYVKELKPGTYLIVCECSQLSRRDLGQLRYDALSRGVHLLPVMVNHDSDKVMVYKLSEDEGEQLPSNREGPDAEGREP